MPIKLAIIGFGKAFMFKILRSIFSRGLETLILELLISGKRAGIGRICGATSRGS
jgi:hypothetical protein